MSSRSPLDDVAFLARSAHRVTVLRSLADGPRTRGDLHDETGVSQPTLGRVLGDFEDRHWAERRGREYALTALGELVAGEFADLVDTVSTVQRLDDIAHHLPTDRMGFDLRRFGSATVTTPQAGDVLRHVRRAEELIAGARRVRLLTDTIAPDSLGRLRDRVVNHAEDDLFAESVITEDAVQQALADPALVGWIRELLESGRAPVFRYDGTIPLILGLADDVAMLAPTDEQRLPVGLVESGDEVVREWVGEEITVFRAEATELTAADLPD